MKTLTILLLLATTIGLYQSREDYYQRTLAAEDHLEHLADSLGLEYRCDNPNICYWEATERINLIPPANYRK